MKFPAPPTIESIHPQPFPSIEKRNLANGIELYILNSGDEALNRIDVLMDCGSYQQPKPLVARFTSLLLKEGSLNYSGTAISEKLDTLGAWLQTNSTLHTTRITLYTLNRCFAEGSTLLADLILHPSFPKKEFETLKERLRQQFLTEQKKVRSLAVQTLYQELFGADHPYGKITQESDFDQLTTADLISYHRNFYHPARCKLFLSGKITPEMIAHTESLFGKAPRQTHATYFRQLHPIEQGSNRRLFTEKPDALQSAVYVGIPLPLHATHPDLPGLKFLCTLLGGYFGSRLMSNIREDKGYTYGINASVQLYPHAALLLIGTQTATQHVEPLIREIHSELDRLQNESVGEEEFCRVKQYIAGEGARISDTPFSVADAYLPLIAQELPLSLLQEQLLCMHTLPKEDLQTVAKQYLDKQNRFISVSGSISTASY